METNGVYGKGGISELVEMFGISENQARSLLTPRASIDVPNTIVESKTDEVAESVFDDADLYEPAEPFNSDLPLNETMEFSDEELERTVYELKHTFD